MLDILSLTLPIFLLIGLGFVAVRTRFVPEGFIESLGFFVLNFALPALVLHALLGQDLRETFDWSYVAVYAGGSLAAFAAAYPFFRIVLRRSGPVPAIAAFGGSSSNTGFLGFPIAFVAIGAPALTALPLTLLVENALIIPLSLALAEMGNGDSETPRRAVGRALGRLLRMPLMAAIVLGVMLSAFGLGVPRAIATTLEMTADAAVACALLVVGGTLAGLKADSLGSDILWILATKLALHPLAVATGFVFVGGVEPALIAAGIIFASAPMLTIYPVFGQRFGLAGLCAAALFAATAASFVTLTTVVALVTSQASF